VHPAAAADAIAKAASEATAFTNPGPYEQAMSEGKRMVMLETFDGFRCEISKQVSPFMAAVHSFHLGTTMNPDGRKSSYAFATQIADDTSLIMARVDPGRGSSDFRLHKALFGGLGLAKLHGSVSQSGDNEQCLAELDVGAHTWAGNVKYGSMGNGLCYGINFIQTVHPNVTMGGEGLYLASNRRFISSYGIKMHWTATPAAAHHAAINVSSGKAASSSRPLPPGMPPPDAAGGSLLMVNYNSAMGAVTVNYKQVVAPQRLLLGAELQFSPLSLESQVVLGAEFKWQRSKLNVCVDGGGRLQSVLEAKLGMSPGVPSLVLSADVDHYNDTMKFGYGLNIDG
jgi:mitochondrial import receptor subunit TOM40